MECSQDHQVFLAYLSRLGYEDYVKSKSAVGFHNIPYCANAGIGTNELIVSLAQQNNEHKVHTEEAKLALRRLLQTELLAKFEIRPKIQEFLKFVKDFMKEFDKAEKQKSDVNSSASTWKTERFQKHLPKLRISFVPPYQPKPEAEPQQDLFSSIQQKHLELAEVYLGAKVRDLELGQEADFLKELLRTEHTEAVSRVFVDALITPILRANGLQLRLEEKLYVKDTLPNCIADYVIYNSDSEVLGVVESKTGGKIKAESVIQCMLQLLVLRTKAPHTLFGVVTDAVRYIFIVLTPGGAFEFEDDQGHGQVRGYHDVTSWKDLFDVASIFTTMLHKRDRDDVETLPAQAERLSMTP